MDPSPPPPHPLTSADDLAARLEKVGYFADDDLARAAWLAVALDRPLLLEGPAGVGKTDLSRALADALGRPRIRLQCYEGLDESKAIYEWNYGKQMLHAQLLRDLAAAELAGVTSFAEATSRLARLDAGFFSAPYLVARPILAAMTSEVPVVFLVDEIDRAEPEFEALLLEALGERQVTIPEIGTIAARSQILAILTTNGTREMSDALRRRCLHAFVDLPTPSRERAILEARVPGIGATLARGIADAAAKIRALDLRKAPSVSETIDWAAALVKMGATALSKEGARATLSAIAKYEEDRETIAAKLDAVVGS